MTTNGFTEPLAPDWANRVEEWEAGDGLPARLVCSEIEALGTTIGVAAMQSINGSIYDVRLDLRNIAEHECSADELTSVGIALAAFTRHLRLVRATLIAQRALKP